MTEPLTVERPHYLDGTTYRIVWPEGGPTYYVTINDIETPEGARPYELFIYTDDRLSRPFAIALAKAATVFLRRGTDVPQILRELEKALDFRKEEGTGIGPNFLAKLATIIERHLVEIGMLG